MAAPAVPRVRVQVGGTIGASAWSCAVWCTCLDASPPVQANFDTAASSLLADFNTDVWGTINALNQSTTLLTNCRVDFYAASSTASSGNGQATGGPFPGTASQRGPASQAMVASLYSATATRRGRGRIYLPATGAIDGTGNTYGFSVTTASNVATNIATWLGNVADAIATNFGGPAVPGVQSLTAGQMFPIVSALVDTRPDRQEHREKAIAFSRFSHAV